MDFAKDAVQAAPLVEIHFDARVVDHPVVPIRWCLSKEAIQLMRDNPAKGWALVILAQEKFNEEEIPFRHDTKIEGRLVVNGLQAIARGADFLQFRAPGDYDVIAYLVSSEEAGRSYQRNFMNALDRLEKRTNGSFHTPLQAMDMTDEQEESQQVPAPVEDPFGSYITAHGHGHVCTSIPKGVFAAELPTWVRKYLRWVGLGVGEDQCAGRWRLFVGFLVMPFVIVLLYTIGWTLFRVWALAMGTLHFMLGGNPFNVWRYVLTWKWEHPEATSFWSNEDFSLMPIYSVENISVLFVPLTWTVFGGLGMFSFVMPWVAWPIFWVLFTIFMLILIIAIFGDKIGTFVEWVDKSAGNQRVIAQVDRLEQELVCGVDKPRTQTIHFSWSGLKRQVCKPRSAR